MGCGLWDRGHIDINWCLTKCLQHGFKGIVWHLYHKSLFMVELYGVSILLVLLAVESTLSLNGSKSCWRKSFGHILRLRARLCLTYLGLCFSLFSLLLLRTSESLLDSFHIVCSFQHAPPAAEHVPAVASMLPWTLHHPNHWKNLFYPLFLEGEDVKICFLR